MVLEDAIPVGRYLFRGTTGIGLGARSMELTGNLYAA